MAYPSNICKLCRPAQTLTMKNKGQPTKLQHQMQEELLTHDYGILLVRVGLWQGFGRIKFEIDLT